MANTCSTPVSEWLDRLVAHFDAELERQETVLRLCEAQGAAARAHDSDALQARTEALNAMFEEAAEAEMARKPILEALVEYYELTRDQQTLSGLIAVTPEPWSHRLAEFQTRLRKTAEETKTVVMKNARYSRRSLKTIDQALTMLTGNEDAAASSYGGAGMDTKSGRHRTPARIDTTG